MRLAIFTYVIHKKFKGDYYAYSPYVREMNLWFKHVEEVEIVAPAHQSSQGELLSGEPYKHSCIVFTKIPSFHLLNFPAVLDSVIKIPFIFFRILGAMRLADHLHIRCPGNIGLLACIAQIFFPKKPKTVKYAGNWDPKAKQPWSYNLQKWILKSKFLSRNIDVLVYGKWEGKQSNIRPFFTASFLEIDKVKYKKEFSSPFEFIYVGNLVNGKRIFESIDLIEKIKESGYPCSLKIFGDGILKESLKGYIERKKLSDSVILKGRKSLDDLKTAYKKAHFIILLSKSEGWPKALAEGMWFGVVPISTKVSCIPWMLEWGERGILIDDKDDLIDSGVEKIEYLLNHREKLSEMSMKSMYWAQNYTLEKFERDIKDFL